MVLLAYRSILNLLTLMMTSRPLRNRSVLVSSGIAVVLVGIVWFIFFRRDYQRLANDAFSVGAFSETVRYARLGVARYPNDSGIILVGADAAERLGDSGGAIEFLEHLPARFDDYSVYSGWLKKADLQIRTGQVSAARATLEHLVSRKDDNALAIRRLARLYGGCGQRYEAVQLLHRLLDMGSVEQRDLVQLAENGRALYGSAQLLRLHAISPQDVMPVSGLLETAWETRDIKQLESLVEDLSVESVELLRSQLKWRLWSGKTQASSGRSIGLSKLVNKLKGQNPHPDNMLVLAQVAIHEQQPIAAQKILHQSILLDPWNINALQMMSDLIQTSDSQNAAQLRELVNILRRIERLASNLIDSESIRLLANDLMQIGRSSEATEWARTVMKQNSASDWAADLILASSRKRSGLSPAATFAHPIEFLAPLSDEIDVSRATGVHGSLDLSSTLDFHDVGSDVGLGFVYDNGLSAEQQGVKMHQWTGGGVAVFDIDADSWPDLYFTQGGSIGNREGVNESDSVFRNQRGLVYQLVNKPSHVNETEFGQGVGAGDINGDGFDDLYIANIGANRLLINQGDGTFVTAGLPSDGHVWTTSVAIADLNGDFEPDLYDVNYLFGVDVFARTCESGGLQRTCGPTEFSSAPDQIFFSDGRGEFERQYVPDPSLDARGMGLVIADIVESGANQIYVANDEAANQLLGITMPGSVVDDSAFKSGVALNQFGQAQGSMGIALGDYDQNGRPDLFVTNYYSEANTLYSQIAKSGFVDRTPVSKLGGPSLTMLGFGCQFFDADSDGDQDLIVANGHLDDFTHLGHPFRMHPQLFVNNGGGNFTEALIEGNYFQRQLLGRAVAMLDWNRDSRCDLVVTHLDDPASLVMNSSIQQSGALVVRLIGTQGTRVPIGATAEVVNDERRQRVWLTAGDGFQCSNQKCVRFAVADPEQQHSIGVRWPGRKTTETVELSQGAEMIIIEGRSQAYSIPR